MINMDKNLSTELLYLRELAAASGDACRIAAGQDQLSISTGISRNDLGLDVYLPSGVAYQGYSAVWLRDFVMSVPSLNLSADYLRQAARLFASSQKTEDWRWYNGFVPAWTPGEHINLDGGVCFYPGSYFTDERQGGRMGPLPPMDSAFFFVELVYQAFRAGGAEALCDEVDGVSLFERAARAFGSVNTHPDTGLAWAPANQRANDFGFCDLVMKIGCLLFGSCLAYQAAARLQEMAGAVGTDPVPFEVAARRIREHLLPTFGTDSGFLNAATHVCRQLDVWGTAFAVYTGALEGEARTAACRALRDAYRNGTAMRDGAVRHILAGDDWADDTAWEYALFAKDQYQNGGYWLTPSGWVLYAISLVDSEAAQAMFADLLAHLRATDFRAGDDQCGPYEWHNPNTGRHGHAVNLTSICCPLQAVERIINEGLWA
jgi:hypothetical protein